MDKLYNRTKMNIIKHISLTLNDIWAKQSLGGKRARQTKQINKQKVRLLTNVTKYVD